MASLIIKQAEACLSTEFANLQVAMRRQTSSVQPVSNLEFRALIFAIKYVPYVISEICF